MNLNLPDKVVPGFPYEGALFWFFSGRKDDSYSGGHPYYVSLYGPDHQLLTSRATALSVLFDDIEFAGADAALPDYQTAITGRIYKHRDLRIRMSWENNEHDYRVLSKRLLELKDVNSLVSQVSLFKDDKKLREHFLCRTILQLHLAKESNAILIGDTFYNLICERVLKYIGDELQLRSEASTKRWTLDPTTLDAFALSIPSASIDTFSSIRQSKEISDYAKGFRNALSLSMENGNAPNALLNLMREAMGKDEIRKKAAGAFQVAGTGANIGGLIPFAGAIASGIGIASDIASRALEKSSAKHQWYLLGPKIQEVAVKELLRNHNPQQDGGGDS